MVVVALLSVDLVESVYVVSVDLVVNCTVGIISSSPKNLGLSNSKCGQTYARCLNSDLILSLAQENIQ